MQDKAIGALTDEERSALNAKLARSGFGTMMRKVGANLDEAARLFECIHGLPWTRAIKFIQDNPPSPECIAFLAYAAHEILSSEDMKVRGSVSHSRNDAARIWIRGEWEKTGKPARGKAEFVRRHIDTMNERFKTNVDERTVRDRWLKTTASHAMRRNPIQKKK